MKNYKEIYENLYKKVMEIRKIIGKDDLRSCFALFLFCLFFHIIENLWRGKKEDKTELEV